VTLDTLGLKNLFLPLLVAPFALLGMWLLARRAALARVGLAMFLFFLAPAFNIAAFPREQAVHDRYLYLPLLGFLILVVPPALDWLGENLRVAAYAGIAVICALLGIQTVRYNRAWLNAEALFTWSIKTDPQSSISYDNLGAELIRQKRHAEAVEIYNQGLAARVQATSVMGRAEAFTELQRYPEAERDLLDVIQNRVGPTSAYTVYQAYERLAICYQRQAKLNEAANLLVEGRKKLPQYSGAMSAKLSVIMASGGKKEEAVAQLEAAKQYARRELLPESRAVFFNLGRLYSELGKTQEARAALREYLALTNGMQDPISSQNRQQAAEMLQKLGG
jgi:tetratricopeptide (TPR) repeat protein